MTMFEAQLVKGALAERPKDPGEIWWPVPTIRRWIEGGRTVIELGFPAEAFAELEAVSDDINVRIVIAEGTEAAVVDA